MTAESALETASPFREATLRIVLAIAGEASDPRGGLSAALVTALQAVDPRVEVLQLSQEEVAFFESRRPLHSTQPTPTQQRLAALLGRADVLITFPQVPADLAEHLPTLRWLQLLTAGADELPDYEAWLRRVPVTTVREVRARPVAEYAIMLLLAFAKRLDGSIALRRRRQWDRLQGIELRGHSLGIVGLGSIGLETAKLAKCFGMRVLASRRSDTEAPAGTVDTLVPAERLHDLLSASDFVVLTAPSTAATYHLIGEAELRAMQPHAVLINVARGALVDEAALVRALREGWIAGAGLDVFEEEPLDPESPLYTLDNVLISCHSAGTTDQFGERVLPILADNVARFLSGRPLRNRIDPIQGY